MSAVKSGWGRRPTASRVTGQAFAENDERFEPRPRFGDFGEPPDNGDMEKRIAKLEGLAEKTGERLNDIDTRLVRIEIKQDEFTKHYATKADIEGVKTIVATSTASIIKWTVSAVVVTQLIPALATWLPKLLGPHT